MPFDRKPFNAGKENLRPKGCLATNLDQLHIEHPQATPGDTAATILHFAREMSIEKHQIISLFVVAPDRV